MNDPAELYHAGKFHEALKLLRRMAEDSPSAANFLNQALCYKAMGHLDEAFQCLEESLALDPKLAVAWNELGLFWDEEGRLGKAQECYQKAIEADPDFAQAWNNLGVVHYLRGEEDEAVRCFQKALQLDPDMESARANLEDLTSE